MSEANKNEGQPEKQTPTENAAGTPQELNPVQPNEQEVFDDDEYQPDFIAKELKNPPILPGESKEEFEILFESFEFHQFSPGRPKTDGEYRLVWQATILTWELQRLEEIKVKVIASQGRAAAETVFRRNLDVMAPGEDIEDPKATVREFGRRYFASADLRTIYNNTLERAGNGPGAIDAEIFLRSLPPLAAIEKLIVSTERRLFAVQKQLDNCFASRDPEEKMPQSPAAKRTNEENEKHFEELKKKYGK